MGLMHRNRPFEYKHLTWGELICGTKEQLNAIGIGVGLAFPGEIGGPKRKLSIHDPRGFPCKVSRDGNTDRFYASIFFADRQFEWSQRFHYAPGITKDEWSYKDVYIGSADALAGIGLVKRECFPGQQGMRRHSVTVYADGSVARNVYIEEHRTQKRSPGAITITKMPNGNFKVTVRVSNEENSRRELSFVARRAKWEAEIKARPRPSPLTIAIPEHRKRVIDARRSALRLVWSRPLPCMDWQLPTP